MIKYMIIFLTLALGLSFLLLESDKKSSLVTQTPNKKTIGEEKEIAVVFNTKVYASDLGNNQNISRMEELALILELESRDKLPKEFHIDTSDNVIEDWLLKENPEALTNSVLGRRPSDANKIYLALEEFQRETITKEKAFDKYLKNIMSKDDWNEISQQFSDGSSLQFLRNEIDKSKEKSKAATIKLYRDRYVQHALAKEVCQEPGNNAEVESFLSATLVGSLSFNSSHDNVLSKVLESKRESMCNILALEKIIKYQKDNIQVVNEAFHDVYTSTLTFIEWKRHKLALSNQYK